MREILFRGKTYNGKWVEGNFIDWGNHVQVYIFPLLDYATSYDLGTSIQIHAKAVIPETVGQYTGLTDNNCKKIFEGDILKVKHGILGREEEKPKMPRNAYGLHYKENETTMYGRWFYYRNYVVEYKAHGNSRGKYIVRNGSDQCDFTNSLFYNHDAEIIGNIHDNPELLKY